MRMDTVYKEDTSKCLKILQLNPVKKDWRVSSEFLGTLNYSRSQSLNRWRIAVLLLRCLKPGQGSNFYDSLQNTVDYIPKANYEFEMLFVRYFNEVKLLSHVRLFVTPCAVVCQAPLSMEFSRQEYWKPFPSPRGSSRPRDQSRVSCIAGRFFTIWATREAWDK